MSRGAMELAGKLIADGQLTRKEYAALIKSRTPEAAALLRERATAIRRAHFGDGIFIRGLIEVSSFCKNDCLYCGLRRSNARAERYRLSPEQILACQEAGYALGFRSFVLQGGEDGCFTDELLTGLIREMKRRHPDGAVTLSLGERSDESYAALREAGADRYLLRHESASPVHYASLHPPGMSFENRMRCLHTLRSLGYQTGCGMMVGTPGQTPEDLAEDLIFIGDFRPQMCGIGPFVPHRDTPFRSYPAGPAELTCFLLSIIRIILPPVLLPATTALGTIHPEGRQMGICSGANVVMPNLSPSDVRRKYELYNNKLSTGAEAAEHLRALDRLLGTVGCHIEYGRGDFRDGPAKDGSAASAPGQTEASTDPTTRNSKIYERKP